MLFVVFFDSLFWFDSFFCLQRFKDFEPDNRLSSVRVDYFLNHVIAYKGKTVTLLDKCLLKSARENSLDILFLMDAQRNSLFDVEMITIIPGSWQGDGSRTSITMNFGDGHSITYSNVSSIEDGIKYIYKNVGIYRVTATAENSMGFETAVLFLHVTCEFLTLFMFKEFHLISNALFICILKCSICSQSSNIYVTHHLTWNWNEVFCQMLL